MAAPVDSHSLDTGLSANNFLVNTEIVEGRVPFCNLHAVVACEVMVDQDILALAVAHYFVVPDLSFDPLTVHPDLNPDLVVAVGPVPAEFLVVNDYSKVWEALANFVLNVYK